MNLLLDKWIPVVHNKEFKRISLEEILCKDGSWEIECFRDDMELAAIQLLICIVQICFIPDNEEKLKQRIERVITYEEYKKGIEPYIEWFDLFHEKWPFMQCAEVIPEKNEKNFKTLQKLYIGLPEKTSSSSSSNAWWNQTDEIKSCHAGDATIALFQQGTNGFSLGGSSFSVGLKGSMPVTTLIKGRNNRITIWYNILTKKFINDIEPSYFSGELNTPTWVDYPIHQKEYASQISLIRGLFWQPAIIKLKHKNNIVSGFYTKSGQCTIKGYWYHPHTPIDIVKLRDNKKKPYYSLRSEPLWSQLLEFFYSSQEYSLHKGTSCALVIQQYKKLHLGNRLHLIIGGYIKGKSTESLLARKHEIYSLSEDWVNYTEMKYMIDIGLKCQQVLDLSCNKITTDSKIKKDLKQKVKISYFRDSEIIYHTYLREINRDDIGRLKSQLITLIKKIYEETIRFLQTDLKHLKGIIKGRKYLNSKIKDI